MFTRASISIIAGLLAANAARADITLIGKAFIPGDDRDKSRLRTIVAGGVPHNRLGAFGSAIDYTGRDNLYIAMTDRGPGDGAAAYQPRFHAFRISINPGSAEPVAVELVSTTILKDEHGKPFSGLAADIGEGKPVRLDPEGVRLSASGSMFVSDEYGPILAEFSRDGALKRSLSVPNQFAIAHPAANAQDELPPKNTSGRAPNRGFEGLAISPDGRKLFAIVQSPLLQDGAFNIRGERTGRHCRILELNIADGAARQFVYTLEYAGHGVSEVLALSNHELLVLERDGLAAQTRGLYKISLESATDVSSIAALPADALPDTIKPAAKSPWLDFLDPRFGLAGPTMPEKIEGLCFGPTLPDGRRTLIITSDNDMKAEQPSWFWVFAFGS